MIDVPWGAIAVLSPDAPATQRVELTFDEHERLALADARAGAVEIEEQIALREYGRLRRIDVFGLARRIVRRGQFGLSRGERHHAALMIADRNHQPAAETRRHGARLGCIAPSS